MELNLKPCSAWCRFWWLPTEEDPDEDAGTDEAGPWDPYSMSVGVTKDEGPKEDMEGVPTKEAAYNGLNPEGTPDNLDDIIIFLWILLRYT